MKGKLVVVSGPSGVGKGTIVKELVRRRADVIESVSCTTRAPREGEVDGREYFFLTKEEFSRRIKEGEFLEYDDHFENYYGTPASFVKKQLESKSVILEIDVKGGLAVKKKMPESVLVMIAPPSLEELRRRLVSRGTETEEQIDKRLSRLEFELKQANEYDFVIVNDELERAIAELSAIVDCEIESK